MQKFIFIFFLHAFLFFSTINAFDNGGNPKDSNGNCPGERIVLSQAGPSPFVGKGNVHGDAGDWSDRFYFTIPVSGTVTVTLESYTDLDFKMSSSRCNNQDLIRYTDRSTNKKVFSFNATANHTYYITIFDNEWRNRSNPYTLKIDYPTRGGTPPTVNSIPDLSVESGENIYKDLSSYVTKTDGDAILEYQLSGRLPSGVSFNSSNGILSGSSSNVGDYTLTLRARDKDGWSNSQSWTLHITQPPPSNIPPIMNDIPNQTLKLGKTLILKLSDYVTQTDGDAILSYHLSGRLPESLRFDESTGDISGRATNANEVGQNFQITVWASDKDGDSNKKSFTIHIAPKGTEVTQGDLKFQLVNSVESRNIRGNYIILGNTVECHTNQKNRSLFEANKFCQDHYYGNNGYIANYIDIDNDPNTWNSSSSNFTLPKKSKILWAGLFWQANLNNLGDFYWWSTWRIQRHAEPKNRNDIHAGWHWVNNTGATFRIENTVANKILIKVDNGNYQQVVADTLAVKNDYYGGDIKGGPYAAFADITNILQQKNLTSGKHTITVANLMATEGLDGDWLGDYGGWAVAIVYQNPNESIKNISIFNGFTIVRNPHGDKPPKYITISGFKLPQHHKVEGYLSVFSAEGEYNNLGDTMKLEGHLMPGVLDKYNVFDEISHNLDRDSKPWYNNLTYANTIDVDRYDVSDIMTQLRDQNPNINKVTIEVATHQGPSGQYDAFFPSMFAFSAQLYVPKVCYDYDIKLGKYYDVPSKERYFKVAPLGDKPLNIKIMLRSQESDFDLLDSKMRIVFTPNNTFKYIPHKSQTTYPNTYSYYQAIEVDSNRGVIAVGANPTRNGGVISPYNFLYSKVYYNFTKAAFNGKFDLYLDAKVSFDGVHKIPYTLSTNEMAGSIFKIDRCPTNPTYDPIYGMFNIERGDSDFTQPEAQRYSLYTQVVGVPYKVSIAAYKKDRNGEYKIPVNSSATVELELIDASSFENNSSTGFDSICKDPDSYSEGTFVKFNNSSREYVEVPSHFKINNKITYPQNLALQNAAFRVWVLTKIVNGQRVVVNHNCKSQYDSKCFDNLYNKEYKNSGKCSNECSNSTQRACYDCLRKYFAIPICSRDNFAIRPQSYSIALKDSGEDIEKEGITAAINDGSTANISADYLYKLEINATGFNNRFSVENYIFSNIANTFAYAIFNGLPTCKDKENKKLNLYLLNGATRIYGEYIPNSSNMPLNGFVLNNSGKYLLSIKDNDWTKVDQKGYPYKPFPNRADCIQESNEANENNENAKRGCLIQTSTNSGSFPDLPIIAHPYFFDLNNTTISSGGSDFIYINDLNKSKDLLLDNKIMALTLQSNIIARGKHGTILSNYTKNCSAHTLEGIVTYHKNPNEITDSFGNILQLQYTIYNQEANDNEIVIHEVEDNNKINFDLDKKYFYVPGIGRLIGFFNIKREYNNPINPFQITFEKLKVQSSEEKMSVDMKKDHIPKGEDNLNITKTFYYAKLKSKTSFYDDILEDHVTTPLYVSIFCDKSLEYCKNFGIDVNTSATDEFNWWININHNSSGENIILETSSDKASIDPSPIDSFTNGKAEYVEVKSLDRDNLPYVVYIKPSQTLINEYPWALFNPDGDLPPSYLFKVRFIKIPSNWSGVGNTGHTIEVNTNKRKSKKLDW